MANPFWEDYMIFPKLWSRLAPLGFAMAALSFGFDQSIKWWLLNIVDMPSRRQITVTPFFDLVMAWNHGVSYGLFTTHTQGLLVLSTLLISSVLWIWLCRTARPLTAAALGLVIGGAQANSCCTGVILTGMFLTLPIWPLLQALACCSMNLYLSANWPSLVIARFMRD
jgi:lipoprotein signal peptidase